MTQPFNAYLELDLYVLHVSHSSIMINTNYNIKQECIPVGCVPAARRPYAGVCFLGGLPGQGGCLPGWGGVCLVGGVLPGLGGSGIPACTEADTLPPCGQTHTCKNITLATTSLRPVINQDLILYYVWAGFYFVVEFFFSN